MSREATTPQPRHSTASSVLTGLCSATPPAISQEALWDGYFAAHFSNRRLARAAFAASGVLRRHAVVDPRLEDVSTWSTSRRMERFSIEAMPLAKAAATGALAAAGLDASELGLLCVVSCTGYATPGVDVGLARDLGMGRFAKRLSVGHVGCHGALPGLETVRDFVETTSRPALLVCLELSSLHLQPPSEDLEQAVVHALFSDAAAGCVVQPGTDVTPSTASTAPRPLEILALCSLSDLAAAEQMTWQVTDTGFAMTLSRDVPLVLGRHVAPLIDELCGEAGIAASEVDHFAVHPGGPRILEVVEERLGLEPDALESAHHVLAEHGNCSSATVLLVLEELREKAAPAPGEHVVLLAFGPGLTLYGALLRAR